MKTSTRIMFLVAAAFGVAIVVLAAWPRNATPQTLPNSGYATETTVPTTPEVPKAPEAATQNTITTTGPVTSETIISLGTLAGQILTSIFTLAVPIVGYYIVRVLSLLAQRIGISMTDAMRARLQEIVVNGLNIAAARGATGIKERATAYVQTHGAQELKAIGVDPKSDHAVEAIKARIETAIQDPNAPTPKALDPVPSLALSVSGLGSGVGQKIP